MKDYIKVIITALLTAIVTLTIAGVFQYPNTQKEKFELVEKNANSYTDKKIVIHEEKEALMIKSITEQQNNTYMMVKFLYERELNKK